MDPIKPVNLRVRPFLSVDLCYPVSGVICTQDANLLGKAKNGLSLNQFYSRLSQCQDDDQSKLVWNSLLISTTLYGANIGGGPNVVLSELRNVPEAADLDSSIAMRQNAYITSYSPNILSEARKVYYKDDLDPKAVRSALLKAAEEEVKTKYVFLDASYKASKLGVVELVHTESNSSGNQYAGGDQQTFNGTTTTDTRGQEYQFPEADNALRYYQARAAIRQENLNAWRMSQMFENDAVTFPNELYSIDLKIKKLQAAYIDTFLVAPFDGIVTGVFKAQGDYVQAGEPVLRVEADEKIYLVGTVKCRYKLRVGSELELETRLFDIDGGAQTNAVGTVVAVRGHDSVSEQWDLLVLCENRTKAGLAKFPLNYNFDFNNTIIKITKL